MKRVVLIGVVLALLGAGEARATDVDPDGNGGRSPYQSWLDLAALKVPVPEDFLRVRDQICPSSHGSSCAYAYDEPYRVRVIYMNPEVPSRLAHVVFIHEVGHIVDFEQTSEGDRAAFTHWANRRWQWRPWLVPWQRGATNTAAELFAWVYRACSDWLPSRRGKVFVYTPARPLPLRVPRYRGICDWMNGLGSIYE